MNPREFLSERTKLIKPSPTLAITAKAKALKAAGVDVISFGAGEPDFDTPQNVKNAAIRAIQEGFTKYTEVSGIPELKRAIAAKLKREHGLVYSDKEILVSCGGKHSLFNIMAAVINPGDEVIILSPYWVSYPDQVLLFGGKPVFVSADESTGFKVTAAQIEKAITPKTKMLIVNSPSNPTGAAYNRDELGQIAAVLEKRPILCVSDEIYDHIVYDGFKQVSIASFSRTMKEKTVIVNGVSKTYSMTGWRMGYAAGPEAIMTEMSTIQGQATSNASSITQKACVEALNGPQEELKQWVKEFEERRDTIVGLLNAIPGVVCPTPQGAFYVFPRIDGLFGKKTAKGKVLQTDDDVADYLLTEAKIAVVSGTGFGLPGYLRLSYAISMDYIIEGVRRFSETVTALMGEE